MNRLFFASDYASGCHPEVLKRLTETNLVRSAGYGLDELSESAREKIRQACRAPEADVFFLSGGTQTNAAVIGCLLKPWQGVLSAATGHICGHEAGAIEAGGHKVLPLPHREGRLEAETVRSFLARFRADESRDHLVEPGMVYISQPTEYGTLYSLRELTELSGVCREAGIPLYADGARLAYALGCPANDVTLPDLARLCDAFYIGGTKCGALFGEAAVFPRRGTVPHFFTMIKQRGALLAKGFVAGVQFDALFTDGLYERIGRHGVSAADRIRAGLTACGYPLLLNAPTNQVFPVLSPAQEEVLRGEAEMTFWETLEDGRTVMRLAADWATRDEDVDLLLEAFRRCADLR